MPQYERIFRNGRGQRPGLTGPPLRVGVMGGGWVAANRHIPSFQAHPRADVVALYDRKPSCDAVAARFGIGWHGCDREAFFAQGLDVVSICTPPWAHAELAVEALGKGLHVFCEKPMAMDHGEASAMVEAAKTAKRVLCVSHNFLWSNAALVADRARERIGPVRHAMAVQLSSSKRRLPKWYPDLPGGLFFDESPHMLYLLQHYLGPLRLESARATRDKPSGLPTMIDAQLSGDGTSATLMMAFEAPLSEWHLVLVGTDGVIALDLFRDIAVHLGPDGAHGPRDILATSARAMLGHGLGVVASGTRYVTNRMSWGHRELIGAFIGALEEPGPSPVDPAQSLSVTLLTDSIVAQLGLR